MTSYRIVHERNEKLISQLAEFSGLSRSLVANVMAYVKMLPKMNTEDIDDLVFIAQMSKRFLVTSPFILALMYNAHKPPKASCMTVEEFSRMICVFLSEDTEIKIDFVFRCYDVNGDDFISRSELHTLLKPSIVTMESEDLEMGDSIKDLIDLIFVMTDQDKNEMIDLGEFREMVRHNYLYLEFLGQVMPPKATVVEFVNLIKNKSPMQVRLMFEYERYDSLCEIRPKKPPGLYPVVLDLP